MASHITLSAIRGSYVFRYLLTNTFKSTLLLRYLITLSLLSYEVINPSELSDHQYILMLSLVLGQTGQDRQHMRSCTEQHGTAWHGAAGSAHYPSYVIEGVSR